MKKLVAPNRYRGQEDKATRVIVRRFEEMGYAEKGHGADTDVEREPLRSNSVARAEPRQWSSAWRSYHGGADARPLLADRPIPQLREWLKRVSRPETKAELDALRLRVWRAQPFGSEPWRQRTIKKLSLEWTVRPRGRPRKNETAL